MIAKLQWHKGDGQGCTLKRVLERADPGRKLSVTDDNNGWLEESGKG